MSDPWEQFENLPAYVPSAIPVEPLAAPARRRLPVVAWIAIALVVAVLLFAALAAGITLLTDTLDRVVLSQEFEPNYPLPDVPDDYAYTPPSSPEPAELPAALAEQIERDFATFEIGDVYAVEDRNHPDVPVYDVWFSHSQHPVDAVVRFWAPPGSAQDGSGVESWGVTFPFFGTGEGSHPHSEGLVAYAGSTPPDAEVSVGVFTSCRKTGEWGSVQAWTCELQWYYPDDTEYWAYYENGQEVFFVDTSSGEWSRERPAQTTTP